MLCKTRFATILDGAESRGRLTRDDVEAIRGTPRLNDGWQIVKRAGIAALPAGDAYEAGGRLIGRLASGGLFVVPVGELERWFPEISGHGTKWVTDALAANLHARADTPVWDFMTTVLGAFAS